MKDWFKGIKFHLNKAGYIEPINVPDLPKMSLKEFCEYERSRMEAEGKRKEDFDKMVEEVLEWFDATDEHEKKMFRDTHKNNLTRYHHSLGRSIRNRFKLWEVKWEPELKGGVDYSENHPDQISMRVIEAVWDKVQS